MKFLAKKDQIVDILQVGAAIAERRQTIPILANLKIKAEGREVEITATDLEIQIKSSSVVTKVEEEGETTVSARKISELCRMLPPNEDLEFGVNQGKLTVKSRNFHAEPYFLRSHARSCRYRSGHGPEPGPGSGGRHQIWPA